MPPAGRIAAIAAAMAVAGCGILPDAALTSPGIPLRVARGGLDVQVSVPGWTRSEVKIVLCASEVPPNGLADLVPFPAQRRDCLEMDTAHQGFELVGGYSFRAASAVRFSAFDASHDWWVVIVGLDQAAPRFTQIRVPGGPVIVE